ncbi:hypothetical protein SDJN02_00366, partial [Cucurbita argyrosperma subsp. argyrosperma]
MSRSTKLADATMGEGRSKKISKSSFQDSYLQFLFLANEIITKFSDMFKGLASRVNDVDSWG